MNVYKENSRDRIKIAFITSSFKPDITEDDSSLKNELEKIDIEVYPLVWDEFRDIKSKEDNFVLTKEQLKQTNLKIKSFDLIIMRSAWNYHYFPNSFLHWIHSVTFLPLQLQNSRDVITWNMNKSYLIDLQNRGVNIADTIWLKQRNSFSVNDNDNDNDNVETKPFSLLKPIGSSIKVSLETKRLNKITNALNQLPSREISLYNIMNWTKWDKMVVKPAISASGRNTFLVTKEQLIEEMNYSYNQETLESKFRSLLSNRDMMVQSFLTNVQIEGEYSLIYFNNVFSHAVIKKPRHGEFRVQHSYGGTSYPVSPSKKLVDDCNKIMNLFKTKLLYARVDGIMVNNKFKLIELELIEPFLFLTSDKLASVYLRDAVIDKLLLLYSGNKSSYEIQYLTNSHSNKKRSSRLKRRKKRSSHRSRRR